METQKPNALLDLGPRQRVAVAVAMTILAVAVILTAILGVGWLAGAFVRRFSHVFLPLAVAGVGALVFQPYMDWLSDRLKFPKVLALVTVIASMLVPFAAFSWFFGALLVEQIADMATRFPAWWDRGLAEAKVRWPEVQSFLDNNPWGQRLKEVAGSAESGLLSSLQAFGGSALDLGWAIARIIGSLFAWAVLPVYFAFFLLAGAQRPKSLESLLPFLKAETRTDILYLVHEFLNIIVAFFRGQLIIALLQGLLFAIGFSLIGLRYGFVIGLLLGFLNIIPYLGSIIGLGLGLPLSYFQPGGGWALLGMVVAVFTIVQMIEGYLLTPRIMGDRTGLHPVAIIVAVFFWGSALGGILGMILAIPLTAFLVVFWRLAREKYIGELL